MTSFGPTQYKHCITTVAPTIRSFIEQPLAWQDELPPHHPLSLLDNTNSYHALPEKWLSPDPPHTSAALPRAAYAAVRGRRRNAWRRI